MLLSATQLTKRYPDETGRIHDVVRVPSFDLGKAEQIALQGPSGSGKTTFLHLLSGILAADHGSLRFDGRELVGLSESQRDAFRAREVGYVFQSFNLMRDYTCLENVALGMTFGGRVDTAFARALLQRVGLGHRIDYRAAALSVGQQQRVALARALAKRPRLVLADEPTGALDAEHAATSLALIRELCQENESALILASHDALVIDAFDRVVDFRQLNAVTQTTEASA